jgi:predicted DNA-binding protein
MPRDQAMLSIYLPRELLERLRAMAQEEGRSTSNFVVHYLSAKFRAKPRKRRPAAVDAA